MPHATQDEDMGPLDEDAQASRFINGGYGGVEEDAHGREFDQTDKDADAIDYEDFSDDELPEEEVASNHLDNGDEAGEIFSQMTNAPNGLPVQPAVNGFHHDEQDASDLMFEDGEEGTADLFGELSSSPEAERFPHHHTAPPQRPAGLALPSKSSLSLPALSGVQQQQKPPQPTSSSASPLPNRNREFSVMSPTSMTSEGDEEDLDPQVALQRSLFRASKLRTAGEDLAAGRADTDMALFNQLYSGYEKTRAPKFVDLFPPRNVDYKGKTPLKPPKVIQPTKLSLDLLQDQERSFKALATTSKTGQDSTFNNSFVSLGRAQGDGAESDDDLALSESDEKELVGGVSMQDLAIICEDWDIVSIDSISAFRDSTSNKHGEDGIWDAEEQSRPAKKRRINTLGAEFPLTAREFDISFEDPERSAARIARSVALDLNDPYLLIDENAPRTKQNLKRMPGDIKRDSALSRDIAKRYNISNDQAYDQLKENHQSKVRSNLGGLAVEHSFPAVKLQYPFYKVNLDNKAKRAFHRPSLELKGPPGRVYRFQKPKTIKRKNVRGREAKDVFAKAEDLSLGDTASMLLLEYSEEAPIMLSNFGMGNRLINYYRKAKKEDPTPSRDKEGLGEIQVLHPQDKSPFSNFGHVENGETVPTIQNELYRAPVFPHKAKKTDFIIGISSTYENGDKLFLRNAEHLHVVGQEFPLLEVPGQHSRKVTDAAKKRLRALSYRIYTKSLERRDKVLDNATLMPHLPGHDMPQTRSKMREFMRYERLSTRGEGSTGVWVPQHGHPVPDSETLRSWVRPEDVCLLDSMQVGVQHLNDIGISESKDGDEDKDIEESANIELQLAPWRATKNFLNACQGKAMLTLHGDGDPTGRGLGFSFVKTSMKGGFQAQGESVEDKMDARRRKDNGGHSYNVAKQQKQYDDSIRRIWEAQRDSLLQTEEVSDDDMDDEPDRSVEYNNHGQVNTPRSSFSTPAAFASRHDDDYTSQFSGQSAGRSDRQLVITRSGGIDPYGQPLPDITETVTNPAVIREYRKRNIEKHFENAQLGEFVPTGDPEKDEFARAQLLKELARIQRNKDRRVAREKTKAAKNAVNSPAAGSPGPSDVDGPANNGTDNTPQKGKGRNKDGTARKCANCGQVGHIKTNRKSVFTFHCPSCNYVNKNGEDDGSHGRSKKGAKRSRVNGGEFESFARNSYSKFEL